MASMLEILAPSSCLPGRYSLATELVVAVDIVDHRLATPADFSGELDPLALAVSQDGHRSVLSQDRHH